MILILGPPGAGKSVQAELLSEKGKVQWLSLGQILRENLSKDVKRRMEKGELVSDEVVYGLLEKALDEAPANPPIMLDGFPRRYSQLEWLVDYSERNNCEVSMIIHLMISEEEALSRLDKRGRLDDDVETVSVRFRQYKKDVTLVVNTFGERGVTIYEIDGSDTIENVQKAMIEKMSL